MKHSWVEKPNQTKIHLWSSEPIKHQEEVWKGNCLGATYLNTRVGSLITSGYCITACNSGIAIFVSEKPVLWKRHKSKGNVSTWLHWHMVMRTFHLWLQSRGPSWQSLGLSSAWWTHRSPWPFCRYPGTAGHPPTGLPPARECDTFVTLPDSWGKCLARINRQTNPKHPEHPGGEQHISELFLLQSRSWAAKLTDQNQQKQLSTSPTTPAWAGHHKFKAEHFFL